MSRSDVKQYGKDCNVVVGLGRKDDAKAFNERGKAKYALKDYQGALEDYDKAIVCDSGYAEAYYNRAKAKASLGDKEGECRDLNEFRRISGDSVNGDKRKIIDLKSLVPTDIRSLLRWRIIVAQHRKVMNLCRELIEDGSPLDSDPGRLKPKKVFGPDETIIWQYWHQAGFDGNSVVEKCFKTVDDVAKRQNYKVVRLNWLTIDEYLDKEFLNGILEKCGRLCFLADVIRTMLLRIYGGVWLDASVMLTGPLPEYMFKNEKGEENEFFAYQRDPDERNQRYWKNTYAYYFGWGRGFRVNILNSVLYSRPNGEVISRMCELLLKIWTVPEWTVKFLTEKTEYGLRPSYFVYQILFDVLVDEGGCGGNCSVHSDCLPHYLAQYINDKERFLKYYPTIDGRPTTDDLIMELTPIHKLNTQLTDELIDYIRNTEK